MSESFVLPLLHSFAKLFLKQTHTSSITSLQQTLQSGNNRGFDSVVLLFDDGSGLTGVCHGLWLTGFTVYVFDKLIARWTFFLSFWFTPILLAQMGFSSLL